MLFLGPVEGRPDGLAHKQAHGLKGDRRGDAHQGACPVRLVVRYAASRRQPWHGGPLERGLDAMHEAHAGAGAGARLLLPSAAMRHTSKLPCATKHAPSLRRSLAHRAAANQALLYIRYSPGYLNEVWSAGAVVPDPSIP